MPWVYTLELTEFKDAGTVQTDWEAIASEQIANDYGGVCVSHRVGKAIAVVVSAPREANYSDMSNYDYVTSVTEHKEIPKRSGSKFDPPVELGHGITLHE